MLINTFDKLQYGIELELVLELPNKIRNNVDNNRKIEHFSKIMKYDLKDINIVFSPGKDIEDYSQWTILEDNSLECNSDSFTLELVSPIITNKEKSFRELEKILTFLKKFNVSTNETCSYHLHISPQTGPFSLTDLKQISKFFLLFENGLNYLNMERIDNKFCGSNRYNCRLRDKTIDDCLVLVDKCKSQEKLVDLLNPADTKSKIVLERGKGIDYGNYYRCQRFYKLNLTNLLNNKNTVEIRSHGGTVNMNTIEEWINIWDAVIYLSNIVNLGGQL
tara:strand:- start:291 stop:1121 length:831 start_codon:yes stop_codon:yes gene_type:complete